MPTPVYIICAESGVQDKERNLVSIFNVLEKMTVQVQIVPAGHKPSRPQQILSLRLWVIAVWRGEPGDEKDEFETEFRLVLPDGKVRQPTTSKTFRFDPVRDLRRFILRMEFADAPPEGVMRIQNRLRKVGTDQWFTQEYLVPVEVQTIEAKMGAESSPPDTARSS